MMTILLGVHRSEVAYWGRGQGVVGGGGRGGAGGGGGRARE